MTRPDFFEAPLPHHEPLAIGGERVRAADTFQARMGVEVGQRLFGGSHVWVGPHASEETFIPPTHDRSPYLTAESEAAPAASQ